MITDKRYSAIEVRGRPRYLPISPNASVLNMVERPTAVWRQNVADDAAGLAAGALDPEEAVAAQLWPDDMIRDTDEVLNGFEADVAGLVNHRYEPAGDTDVFDVIER